MTHMRRLPAHAALIALLCWGMLGGDAVSQTFMRNRDFLNLGAPEEYLNYGRKEYDPYPAVINARNQYDRLGNYLSRGYDVFSWEFSRPGYSSISTRTAQYLGWFGNLIMLSDSYRGWNYRMTLGEDIRMKFSDLTMKDPRFFGVLLDGASSDNKFTLLLSQGGDLLNIPKFSTFRSTNERSPVLMFGGHWESKLGSILRLGGTYFNQHMANTFDENGSFLKGDTPYSMLPPSFIEVIIEDDSPDEAGTPAVVYGVDVIIHGESMGQAVRMTSIAGDPDYAPMVEAGQPTGGTPTADGGRQVAGRGDRVIYQFTLPEYNLPAEADYAGNPDIPLPGITIKAVRFLADVSGDYRILVRQKYLYFDESVHQKNMDKLAEGDQTYAPGGSRYINPFTGLKGADSIKPIDAVAESNPEIFRQWPVPPEPTTSTTNPFMQYKWDLENPKEVAYTVLRSDGKDRARKVVSFDYGIPTGQALYGLDWDLTLNDLTVKGEFISNPQYFIFPSGSNAGKRNEKRTWAYMITARKPLAGFELGAEVFNMDPDYSGNYDSVRGGIPFFSDKCTTCPQMQEMNVMTDNDDNDQWPDEFNNERPSAEKSDSGIFPGLDENMDLVPDSDQNINGIADWTEPILFYDADPPEFVYGIDFNNNGVVDFRENDALPDYPYRRDRQGVHLLLLRKGLGHYGKWASLGWYGIDEPAGGNDAKAFYARYEHNLLSPYFGRLRINDDIKLVKDSIRDDVYVWKDVGYSQRIPSPYPHLTGKVVEARDLNSQIFPPDPDPLAMRNSLVNTLFIESIIKQVSGVNIINNILWIRNSQRKDEFDDGTSQDEGVVSQISIINKIDYTFQAGNLSVSPRFKHLLMRQYSGALEEAEQEVYDEAIAAGTAPGTLDKPDGLMRSFSIYAPILRTRFDLTPKSNLQLGFQGLPFWRHRMVDRVDSSEDFKEWTMVLMMTNRSDHYGYNLASQFGYIRSDRKYDDDSRGADNFDNSRIFFDIVAGF